jgi:SAM-dependent methyltransferase
MSIDLLKQAVQAQFGATAEAYVSSPTHANGADLQRMVELARLRGDERVLDIATGGGHTALAFAPHVREVVATDLTPQMLAAAARFITSQGVANVRFERADAEALPFPAAEFDVVTCRIAPHHFGDAARFVREVRRVLRPGGVLLLVDTIAPDDPALDALINAFEQLRDPSHVRNYTLREWQAFCLAAGLRVAHSEIWTKTLPFVDWCQRANVSPATQAELERRLLTASSEARAAFEVAVVDGRVTAFGLPAALLLARAAES